MSIETKSVSRCDECSDKYWKYIKDNNLFVSGMLGHAIGYGMNDTECMDCGKWLCRGNVAIGMGALSGEKNDQL